MNLSIEIKSLLKNCNGFPGGIVSYKTISVWVLAEAVTLNVYAHRTDGIQTLDVGVMMFF
ncbi:hypothetical protein ACWGOQ_0001515 [Aquimarina sp. M1]